MNLMTYARTKIPLCLSNNYIPENLYSEYGVKRGLRDENGRGVVTGLTSISTITAFRGEGDNRVPCDGELRYRGYNIRDIVFKTIETGFGYEKTAYLLLFGELPDDSALAEFKEVLGQYRKLPANFVRDYIMKAISPDIMNSMSRNILALASFDKCINSVDPANSLRQCIALISVFPSLAVYCYQAYNHFHNNGSMYIHSPSSELSAAENILRMLRPDKSYTALEARSLDLMLLMHMEQGGGNNSTFTARAVTSAGADTYSTAAAAMCSLKGARHGGACIKVRDMMIDIFEHVSDPADKDELRAYLQKILDRNAFDRSGLIYGIGHPIFKISDPRAVLLKQYALLLSQVKGKSKYMQLYENIEELAPIVLHENNRTSGPVCANIDFYSGFIYSLLNIPHELYVPLYATAMISGWCAHRMEELSGADKIMYPAYIGVCPNKTISPKKI